MAANLLRQARRIPVECYPILGVVAFSLSAGVRPPFDWQSVPLPLPCRN